jgi:hypothetical protein
MLPRSIFFIFVGCFYKLFSLHLLATVYFDTGYLLILSKCIITFIVIIGNFLSSNFYYFNEKRILPVTNTNFFYCRFSQVHSRILDDLFHGTVYVSTIYDAVKHYPQLKNNSARICVIFTQLTCYQHSICSQLTIRGHVNSFMHIWGTHWSNGVSIFFKWNFRPQLTKQLTDKALTSYNHWQSAKLRT